MIYKHGVAFPTKSNLSKRARAESVEWFIEEQTFSPSYDMTRPPLSLQQVVSLSQSCCVSLVELTYGKRAGGVGGGAKSYDGENSWSFINHSIHSGSSISMYCTVYYM
jgi:hypothetical protein